MSDLLADWWVHPVAVSRYLGAGEAGGESLAAPETVTGFYDDHTIYNDGQITASGRFSFPADIAYIPVQSLLTLPDRFGGRTVRVIASAVGDGSGQPTPDHQTVHVL